MVCVEGEVRYHTHFQQKEREAKEAADNKAAAAQAERDRKALEQSNAVSFFCNKRSSCGLSLRIILLSSVPA